MDGNDLQEFIRYEFGCFLLIVLGLAAIFGAAVGFITIWIIK